MASQASARLSAPHHLLHRPARSNYERYLRKSITNALREPSSPLGFLQRSPAPGDLNGHTENCLAPEIGGKVRTQLYAALVQALIPIFASPQTPKWPATSSSSARATFANWARASTATSSRQPRHQQDHRHVRQEMDQIGQEFYCLPLAQGAVELSGRWTGMGDICSA